MRVYRGDASRYATGVAQPVNIAGWDSGWWVPKLGLSTPCRGTHQRLAPGCGNQVHLIWATYIALAPTLDPYLHCLASFRGCASSATAAARP